MDTSETYIKMCDCEEIQELRREEKHKDTGKWSDGDFWTTVFDSAGGHVFVACKGNDAWADEPHYLHHPIECIWLPRQDQLQEMVSKELTKNSPIWALKAIDAKIQKWYDRGDESWIKYTSMEQLWLAFVMKELYSKQWNGNECEIK